MRKPFIAGNWKMNTDAASGPALAAELVRRVGQRTDMELAVFPPFPYLGLVRAALAGSRVELGGQNCYPEAKGAFTGEVSPAMLMDMGCAWALIGHSERRHLLGETDGFLKRKVASAFAAGLKVIYCVGETLAERQANQTEAVVKRQLEGGLAGLSPQQAESLVIAYEPVWAIGTGQNATPEQAEAVHRFIRDWLKATFGPATSEALRIQYGGSVNPGNAASLLSQPNLDGFLVGGASLKADDFVRLIDAGMAAAATRTR